MIKSDVDPEAHEQLKTIKSEDSDEKIALPHEEIGKEIVIEVANFEGFNFENESKSALHGADPEQGLSDLIILNAQFTAEIGKGEVHETWDSKED